MKDLIDTAGVETDWGAEPYQGRVPAEDAHVTAALRAMPGLTCHQPGGAFYAYPGIAGLLGRRTRAGTLVDDDAAFCQALLMEEGVATVHGGAFGASPYVRISTAASEAMLEQALARIERFVGAMQ